jgi:hypothetical protein
MKTKTTIHVTHAQAHRASIITYILTHTHTLSLSLSHTHTHVPTQSISLAATQKDEKRAPHISEAKKKRKKGGGGCGGASSSASGGGSVGGSGSGRCGRGSVGGEEHAQLHQTPFAFTGVRVCKYMYAFFMYVCVIDVYIYRGRERKLAIYI